MAPIYHETSQTACMCIYVWIQMMCIFCIALTDLRVKTRCSSGEIGWQRFVDCFFRYVTHCSSRLWNTAGFILRYCENLFSSFSNSGNKWWYSPCMYRSLLIGCTENRRIEFTRFLFFFHHHHSNICFFLSCKCHFI